MRNDLRSACANHDFVAVEEVVRGVVRRGDTGAMSTAADALWAWLIDAWRARPLPRLAELLSLLGPVREGQSAQALRATDEKYIDDVLWREGLRGGGPEALDAVLDTLTRARSRDVLWRVEQLQQHFADTREPRLTTRFLRWMEAPPLRAVSSQPMWLRLFDLLFEQGDPRCIPAWEALAESDFPAGKTMQTWMHEHFVTQKGRWEARDDYDDLLALGGPDAEDALGGNLDPLSAAVAYLTGGEFIEGGGDAAQPAVSSVLKARPVVPSPFDGPLAVTGGVDAPFTWLQGQSDARGARLAVSDQQELAVFDERGRLLWLETAQRQNVGGYVLHASGRWLAVHLRGGAVRLVDLDQDRFADHTLVAGCHHPSPPPGQLISSAASVCFDGDQAAFFSVHVSQRSMNPPQPAAVVLRACFDPETLALTSVEEVLRRDLPADEPGERLLMLRPDAVVCAHPDRLFASFPTRRDSGERCAHIMRRADGWRDVQSFWMRTKQHGLSWGRTRRLDDGRLAVRTTNQKWAIGSWRSIDMPDALLVDPATAHVEELKGKGEAYVPGVDSLQARAPGRATVPLVAAAARCDTILVALDRNESKPPPGQGPHIFYGAGHNPVAIAVSPDGDWYVAATNRNIYRYEQSAAPKGRKKAKPKRLSGHKDTVTDLKVGASTGRIFSLAKDAVMVWSGAGEPEQDLRHPSAPSRMALHADELLLASCDGEAVYLWDVESGGEVVICPLPDGLTPTVMGWSLDSAAVWLGDAHNLWSWDPLSGRFDTVWTTSECVLSLAVDPPRGIAVVGTESGTVIGLRQQDGLLGEVVLARQGGPVRALAIACNGAIVVGTGRWGASGAVNLLGPEAADDGAVTRTRTQVEAASPPPIEGFPVQASNEHALLEAVAQERQRVLSNPPASSVPKATRDKIRKGLRHATRRSKAIKELVEVADDAWWAQLLAEPDLTARYAASKRDEPLFGDCTGVLAFFIAKLLPHAPQSLPIASALRARFTRFYQVEDHSLHDIALPNVKLVYVGANSGWSDLMGFPNVTQLEIDSSRSAGQLQATLDALKAPPGLTHLVLRRIAGEAPPSLAGTPFTHVTTWLGSVTPRSGLGAVESFSIGRGDGLDDLAFLEGCRKVRDLHLWGMEKLTSLKGVDAMLAAGAPLRTLRLVRMNALHDLIPLAGARMLTELRVERVPLRDGEVLGGLSALERLELDTTELAELPPLSSRVLKRLSLDNGKVRSVDFLAGAAATLEDVSLRGCDQLKSIDALSGAASLRVVDLRECAALASVEALDACPALELVALHGTPFTPASVSAHLRTRATWAATPEHPLLSHQDRW